MKIGNTFKAIIGIIILMIIIVVSGFTLTKDKKYKYLFKNQVKQENILAVKSDSSNTKKEKDDSNKSDADKTNDKNTNEEERVETIKVSAVGDFLIHEGIINSQYVPDTGAYDFSYNFQYIKSYIENSDLSIGNLETTFAGSEVPYAGYPTFNCPDQLSTAMKDIGIDVVCDMSNHTLDEGESAFYRTRQVLKDTGFDVIGTREKADDKRYTIKEVNGIKLGIIGYGYTTDDGEGTLGLNGIPISDEVKPLMNIFNPNNLTPYLEEMKEQIAMMRNDGADAVIFYIHWGEEYQLEPNESQLQIAKFLADQGVDIIFGDHPHTIQPVDVLTSSDGKSKTAVIYSLGNFISCQRTETLDNPYTEDGVIVDVKITKNFKNGEVVIDTPTYIPTWVKADSTESGTKYTVVPCTRLDADYLESWQSQRLQESFTRTSNIVESYNQSINVDNN